MRRAVIVFAVVFASGIGVADPVPTERIVAMLHEGDFDLRAAAEAALVQAPGDPDLAEAAKDAPGRVERVRRARALAARIRTTPKGSVERWMAIEEAFDPEMRGLSTAILTAAFGRFVDADAVTTQREVARGIVAEVCRAYETSTWTIDASSKMALEARLLVVGKAAAPHLLAVLARRPENVWYVGDFTFRQMRAMRAAALLGLRDAVPHLRLHLRQPSASAEGEASMALARLLGEMAMGKSPFPVESARSAFDRWWGKHRDEYGRSLSWLGREVFAEAREDVSLEAVGLRKRTEIAGPPGWEDTDRRVRALGTLGGIEMSVDPDLPAAERLKRIAAHEEAWRARFGE